MQNYPGSGICGLRAFRVGTQAALQRPHDEHARTAPAPWQGDRVSKRDHLHAKPLELRGYYARLWSGARYMHHVPFWRAGHREGIALGSDEGGSSYQVGRDLYVQAHDGTDYHTFIVPFHFAGKVGAAARVYLAEILNARSRS